MVLVLRVGENPSEVLDEAVRGTHISAVVVLVLHRQRHSVEARREDHVFGERLACERVHDRRKAREVAVPHLVRRHVVQEERMLGHPLGVPKAVEKRPVSDNRTRAAQVERVIQLQGLLVFEKPSRPQGRIPVVVRSLAVILVGPAFGDGVVIADARELGAVIHRLDFNFLHVLHVDRLGVEVFFLHPVHAHIQIGATLSRHVNPELVSGVGYDLRHGSEYGKG